jgi:hypothetical protein
MSWSLETRNGDSEVALLDITLALHSRIAVSLSIVRKNISKWQKLDSNFDPAGTGVWLALRAGVWGSHSVDIKLGLKIRALS